MSEMRTGWSLLGLVGMGLVVAGCSGQNGEDPNGTAATEEQMVVSSRAPATEPTAADTAERTVEPAAITPAIVGPCSAGKLCFYRDINYGPTNESHGELAQASPYIGVYSHPTCQTGNWNDCISSLQNTTSRCWVLYNAASYDYRSGWMGIDPYGRIANVGVNMNDKISSVNPNGAVVSGRCHL